MVYCGSQLKFEEVKGYAYAYCNGEKLKPGDMIYFVKNVSEKEFWSAYHRMKVDFYPCSHEEAVMGAIVRMPGYPKMMQIQPNWQIDVSANEGELVLSYMVRVYA